MERPLETFLSCKFRHQWVISQILSRLTEFGLCSTEIRLIVTEDAVRTPAHAYEPPQRVDEVWRGQRLRHLDVDSSCCKAGEKSAVTFDSFVPAKYDDQRAKIVDRGVIERRFCDGHSCCGQRTHQLRGGSNSLSSAIPTPQDLVLQRAANFRPNVVGPPVTGFAMVVLNYQRRQVIFWLKDYWMFGVTRVASALDPSSYSNQSITVDSGTQTQESRRFFQILYGFFSTPQ